MASYFAERINHILPEKLAEDFRKFYVDTALLGNPKALALAVDYFGFDHVLFGTDAPLGIATALLGNPKALELAVDYFGFDHVLFGTDAPLGIAPTGATVEIIQAIEELPLTEEAKDGIFQANLLQLIRGEY